MVPGFKNGSLCFLDLRFQDVGMDTMSIHVVWIRKKPCTRTCTLYVIVLLVVE